MEEVTICSGCPEGWCDGCAPIDEAEYERAMREEGYHKCPDGKWRRTPGNGMFDGICGACEYYIDYPEEKEA